MTRRPPTGGAGARLPRPGRALRRGSTWGEPDRGGWRDRGPGPGRTDAGPDAVHGTAVSGPTSGSREITRIGVVGLSTIRCRHRRGLRPQRLRRGRASTPTRRRSTAAAATSRSRRCARVTRGKATEEERQAILDRIRLTVSRRHGRPRPRDRGRARAPSTSSARSSSSSTRSSAPSRSSRPTPRRCRSPTSPSPPSARRRSSACTSSTRPGAEVRRGREDRRHRRRRGRRRRGRWRRSLDKPPVVVGDKAGFIANALLFGYLNHAANMFETKYASREDIDAAMKLGCGLPMVRWRCST